MAKYEFTLVLPVKQAEAKQKAVLEKVKKAVEEAKGKVEKEESWGKKTLAYPIDKQTEGVYFFLELSLPAEKVGEINRLVEMDEEVLRHLLVKAPVR